MGDSIGCSSCIVTNRSDKERLATDVEAASNLIIVHHPVKSNTVTSAVIDAKLNHDAV